MSFVMKVKDDAPTVMASAPLAIPNKAVPGFAIADDAITMLLPVGPEAEMLTLAVCALLGFVMSNLKVYLVPATSFFPFATVRVRVGVENELVNCSSPSSPASTSAEEAPATAPVSPVIVTMEVAASSVPVTSVTVILFVAPGYGLF